MPNRERMRMPRIEIRTILAVAVLAGSLFAGYAIVAQAQGPEPTDAEIAASGIAFPVPELGGCKNKAECKSYCDKPQNMPACIAFAEKHGLMSKEEAQFARKFKDRLDVGGPGGCRTPRDCEAYCSSTNHIEECVSFAEERGVKDKNVDEGKKILNYIRSGGQMPGGCTSRESCEAYCGDFSHAEECFAFAEKAGLTMVNSETAGRAEGRFEGGIPPGQFQKMLELIKRGETPGGCKSKQECETYCENPNHLEECVAFGEKVGFIQPEQAKLIRETGGMGPGGCRGPRECEAYCNTPERQEECFKFAEEHGLISPENLKSAKEGLTNLRAGIEQAPPEVAACLKATLGQNIIADIEAGKLLPGPAIGEKMKACFEKFGHRGAPEEVFENAPPQAANCIKEKLGADFDAIRSGEKVPRPEIGNMIRACFEQFGPKPGTFLQNTSPEVLQCLKSKIGADFERIKAGEIPPGKDFESLARSCFEQFKPRTGIQPEGFGGQPQTGGQEGFTNGGAPGGFQGLENLPPDVLSCAKRILGEGVLDQLRSGQISGEKFAEAVKRCFYESGQSQSGGGGITPPPFPSKTAVCPAMPTVAECPAGQRRVIVYSSPECGTYYGCKAESDSGTVCAQVITPARDPATGYCKNFPTPCDVPQGWSRVSSCEPTIYQEDPSVRCAKEGGTWDAAVKYCIYPQPTQTYPGGQTYPTTEPTYSPPPGGSLLDVFKQLLFFVK